MPGADELRVQAVGVARGWSPPGAPRSWRLTAALFEAIAAHDGLLDRLAVLPADRLPALLGSAAIAFLVRRDRPVRLAGYFPEPGAAQPRFDEGFFPAFAAFCAARLDDIAELCQARRYQTVLGARTFDRASDRSRLLARAHPSGQWIEWLSPRPSASPGGPAR